MATVNPTFQTFKLNGTYNANVTQQVLKVVEHYQRSHPEQKIFMMGWGHTTQPLSVAVVNQLVETSQRLGCVKTYTSYENIAGNQNLIDHIVAYYADRYSVHLDAPELFVTDGAQSPLVNILELFGTNDRVAIQNPWYPAFIEGILLSGRTELVELKCCEQSQFIPDLPQQLVDIIYLCSPNNPTGSIFTRTQLQAFVNYARVNHAIIIFDAVYSHFVSDPSLPRSIYEIEGAKECAIEVNSLSKVSNFTGLRLGWVIVPDALKVENTVAGELRQNWQIRNAIKFWGASNLAQQAAIGALSPQGQLENARTVNYYLENARLLRQGLENCGVVCYGGDYSPYLWIKAPQGWSSSKFFHYLLTTLGLVGIPGSFFGSQGEGFIRLSTLGSRTEIEEIITHLDQLQYPNEFNSNGYGCK